MGDHVHDCEECGMYVECDRDDCDPDGADLCVDCQLTQAKAEVERLRTALERLLLLIDYETNLPYSAANGVTDPTGTIDEGVVRASEDLEQARNALKGNGR